MEALLDSNCLRQGHFLSRAEEEFDVGITVHRLEISY